MDIFHLENLRTSTLGKVSSTHSTRQRIILIKNYFDLIINQFPQSRRASTFFHDFIEEYLSCFKNLDVAGIELKLLQSILTQIDELKNHLAIEDYKEELTQTASSFNLKIVQMDSILTGCLSESSSNRIFFPVVEERLPELENIPLGLLETLTIKISKAAKQNSFLIIPRERMLEENLSGQIKNSWAVACNYLRKQKRKINKYHEVIIYFDKMLGTYTGSSLGVALAIGFINELLKYYNAPYLVRIKNNIAITGSINESGEIESIGEEIIKEKIYIIFFSHIQTFILPSINELTARRKLKELNEIYPKRGLELIGVKSLNDLLDRRSIVDIKKQNPVVRTAKNVKRHWGVSLLFLLLILLLGYFYLLEYDYNPAILESKKNILYVKNKSGKTLWTKRMKYEAESLSDSYLRGFQKIVDINNDGINELLLCEENLREGDENKEDGRIVCLDNKNKTIWKYTFADNISTKGDSFSRTYTIGIIDTTSENNKRIVILTASNVSLYPTAVFKLDLRTGERLEGTLWHPGRIVTATIKDFDSDGNKELVACVLNNGYRRIGVFEIDLGKLNGTAPSSENFHFIGTTIGGFKNYILFPITDYNRYFNLVNSYWAAGAISYNDFEKEITLSSLEGKDGDPSSINYKMDYNFRDIEIIINSAFGFRRDNLVSLGKLNPPLTNTKEYSEVIKSQILYWNGREFIKKYELK
jgi:hypothetical protein